MMDTKKAIKRMLKKLISEAFYDYVSDQKLEEIGWEYLRTKLDLVGLDGNLYYTRSKAVMEAQATLWGRIKELADKYELNAEKLWKNHIVEPIVMFYESYEELLEEKELKNLAEYVGIGYDDREGGFLVFVNPEVVNKLLYADENRIAKRFIEQISEKELNELEQEYWRKVEECRKEGWKVSKQELLREVVEDYLLEDRQEELLAWLYVEESEDMKKFVEAIKEIDKELVAYLSDIDYIEKCILDKCD